MTTEEIITNLGEEEWENFQPGEALAPDVSGKLWNSIHKNTATARTHSSYFKWMAAAASVLAAAGLSWLFIVKRQSPEAIALTRQLFNSTPQKKALTLSDGSTVELSPNSKFSYPEHFSASKRAVILNGEANFDIAKDDAKPFTVSSNAVLVTVLGTRFTLNAYEGDNTTKVILHEGKVMVKIANTSNQYILSPGDIFIFKKTTTSARVVHLEKDKEDGYVFNNYPLDVVFDQLQIIYHVKIIYNKAEIGNRSFIGKIDKKDPLDHILKSIALLNNFDLRQQGDSMMISNHRAANSN